MQPKLTIGDRVITTRLDGEIGTVCGIYQVAHGYWQAVIKLDSGQEKWIGVDYLTVETSDNQLCDSSEALEAVF